MKKKLSLKNKFIPVNIPKIFSEEKLYVKKCLDTGWISSEGNYVKKFEKDFSKYNKRVYGVAVSSGTAALELAVKCLNLAVMTVFTICMAVSMGCTNTIGMYLNT